MDRRSFLGLRPQPADNFELSERSSGVVEANKPGFVLPRRDFVAGTAAALLTGSMLTPGSDAHGAESVERERELLFEWPDDPDAPGAAEERRKMRKMFNWVKDDRDIQTKMAEAQRIRDEDFADPKEYKRLLEEYDFLQFDERQDRVGPKERKQATFARLVEENDWATEVLEDQQKWLKQRDPTKDKARKSHRAEYYALNSPPDGFKLVVPSQVQCSPGMKDAYARYGEEGFTASNGRDVMVYLLERDDGANSGFLLVGKNPDAAYREKDDRWNPYGFIESGQYPTSKFTWDDAVNACESRLRNKDKIANRVASANKGN
ncbi:MAG: hypothetical protein QF809_02720 [Candidatus Peribacteraceae bacterium]|jgi:hypothetical protein|nr:hypothetical protein [Candidatus Peribacteraceae bacterium]MDP7645553.1 hypothetical protein [Candidatus Peribacteraceae bacterium]